LQIPNLSEKLQCFEKMKTLTSKLNNYLEKYIIEVQGEYFLIISQKHTKSRRTCLCVF
jgi:hypothetical protein